MQITTEVNERRMGTYTRVYETLDKRSNRKLDNKDNIREACLPERVSHVTNDKQ
jgi:hypothetical protein